MPVGHPSTTIQPQAIWLWLDQLIREILCGVRSCLVGGRKGTPAGLLSFSVGAVKEVSRLRGGSSSMEAMSELEPHKRNLCKGLVVKPC